MASRDDYLFSKGDGFSVQEYLRRQMEDEIANIEPNRLLNTNIDDFVSYFVGKYHVDVPVLDEANMTVDHQEAKRDVSGDARRMGFYLNPGQPMHVTAQKSSSTYPFRATRNSSRSLACPNLAKHLRAVEFAVIAALDGAPAHAIASPPCSKPTVRSRRQWVPGGGARLRGVQLAHYAFPRSEGFAHLERGSDD